MNRATALIVSALLIGACHTHLPRSGPATSVTRNADDVQHRLAAAGADEIMVERVREATLHAWNGYRRHAWGHDALKPISAGAHDWYAQSLLMTPVDALDTLLLMGLNAEADEARELIASHLSFDHDMEVKHFEIVIRLLGGLLSGYQMTGDERLLALADDLGTRLLPAFDSPTGLPWVNVNLRTSAVSGRESNPAETGTLILEYGLLSQLTGKTIYAEKAKRALTKTFERRSAIGLVGERFDVVTGEWTQTRSHVGARIDSYYEYLWKCWQLFGDADCKRMWDASIHAVNTHVADEVDGELWYGHADMTTGERLASRYGALDAFFPGLLALSGDLERASRLHASSISMWRAHGIEPEAWDYRRREVLSPGYPLRPEIVESTWYLYRLTGDPAHRTVGRELFDDFVTHTRTQTGFAALADVTTKEKRDDMESFVLAETFKHFYLLFADPKLLDPATTVLTTEAHPLTLQRSDSAR